MTYAAYRCYAWHEAFSHIPFDVILPCIAHAAMCEDLAVVSIDLERSATCQWYLLIGSIGSVCLRTVSSERGRGLRQSVKPL